MHILHNYCEVQLNTTFKTQTQTRAQVSPNTKPGFRTNTPCFAAQISSLTSH